MLNQDSNANTISNETVKSNKDLFNFLFIVANIFLYSYILMIPYPCLFFFPIMAV